MTDYFKKTHPDWNVYHLSSHLTPRDRETILTKVHAALGKSQKILLVATSVVECGIDFSFDLGFREKGSMLSTIQFGGRVARHEKNGIVYEFSFKDAFFKASEFTKNPDLNKSLEARRWIKVDAKQCSNVIREEVKLRNKKNLKDHERNSAFKIMNEEFCVIDDDTIQVIVDRHIFRAIQQGGFVSPIEISRASVAIHYTNIEEGKRFHDHVGLYESSEDGVSKEKIYYWKGLYDKDLYGIYAPMVGWKETLDVDF
jgi:CRISPR-associated endonuclease/helicase Cas3